MVKLYKQSKKIGTTLVIEVGEEVSLEEKIILEGIENVYLINKYLPLPNLQTANTKEKYLNNLLQEMQTYKYHKNISEQLRYLYLRELMKDYEYITLEMLVKIHSFLTKYPKGIEFVKARLVLFENIVTEEEMIAKLTKLEQLFFDKILVDCIDYTAYAKLELTGEFMEYMDMVIYPKHEYYTKYSFIDDINYKNYLYTLLLANTEQYGVNSVDSTLYRMLTTPIDQEKLLAYKNKLINAFSLTEKGYANTIYLLEQTFIDQLPYTLVNIPYLLQLQKEEIERKHSITLSNTKVRELKIYTLHKEEINLLMRKLLELQFDYVVSKEITELLCLWKENYLVENIDVEQDMIVKIDDVINANKFGAEKTTYLLSGKELVTLYGEYIPKYISGEISTDTMVYYYKYVREFLIPTERENVYN